MRIKQLRLGPMANFIYLIEDSESATCAAVDPAWDAAAIRAAAEEDGCRITRILLTHNHPDHVNGVEQLAKQAGLPVYIHEDDAFALEEPDVDLHRVKDKERIAVGEHEIECLHTPGHTEGSQCFLFGDRLLTGDTLFIGGAGRVDLPGSDPRKMYKSLRRLARLPGSTKIFPGHAYGADSSATLEVERGRNPYIRACLASSADEFARLVGF